MSGCVIIAECGLNHNGHLDLALRLVDEAKEAGADVAKFQYFIPENLFRQGDPDAEKISALALSGQDMIAIAKHCKDVGIEFMCTPDCTVTLDFLVTECAMRVIKIGSADLTNVKLMRAAAETGLPMVISTGMATMNEIEDALNESLLLHRGRGITLMHCVSLYPTPIPYANLKVITTLRERFPFPIGYSDHTASVLAPLMAVALGASVIEMHVGLMDHLPIVDAEVTYPMTSFRETVSWIREAESALGDGRKIPTAVECAVRDKIRKGPDGLRGVA